MDNLWRRKNYQKIMSHNWLSNNWNHPKERRNNNIWYKNTSFQKIHYNYTTYIKGRRYLKKSCSFLFQSKYNLFTYISKQNFNVKPWTYILGRLTTLLSIFLFLLHIFIPLNVFVYILMIYKWSKIREWFAFWLNINEMQPWKFIGKNRNAIFLGSALLL